LLTWWFLLVKKAQAAVRSGKTHYWLQQSWQIGTTACCKIAEAQSKKAEKITF